MIGIEISDTADQFENTVHWDFHDANEDRVSRFDFVYSNSLDQAWKPELALETVPPVLIAGPWSNGSPRRSLCSPVRR